MVDVNDETDLTTLVGENDEFKKLVESKFQSSEVGNLTWGKAKVYTKDEFLDKYGSGSNPVVRNFLVAWIAHYRLGAEVEAQKPAAAPPKVINTNELWQSILRITSDVEGDVATALVFDVFQDDKGPFLYLLTNEHYHLKEGNTYYIQYCRDDNVFVEVDRFERKEFEVWQTSKENGFVIYKLALSSDVWEAGAGMATRKPGPASKRPRRAMQKQPAPKAPVVCKTPTFWFQGVHPGDKMCVYALPGAIPGRWISPTSVTNVGHSMFYLQALSVPGGSGGAVLATKSGKMSGFIGGCYDVKEPESTNPKKFVDRRFNTYAFSVHALPRRLSSPPIIPKRLVK